MLLLTHLSTLTTDEPAVPGAADLDEFLELAMYELKTSAGYVSQCAAMLEVSLTQESVFGDLREMARQIRLHAELVADLIDDVSRQKTP